MFLTKQIPVCGLVLLLAAACGGEQTAAKMPAAAPTATVAATPSASGPTSANASDNTVWRHDFTKEQAMAFMNARVLPPMTKVFQEYDAKKYSEVSCKTCHGPAYKEPKDFLPRLTMKEGKLLAFAEKPAVSKFMAEKVVPAMASAMGQPPYDPATHKGFGCGGCHAIDMR